MRPTGTGSVPPVADHLRRLEDEKERLRSHFGRELQHLEDALHREQFESLACQQRSQQELLAGELIFVAEVRALEEMSHEEAVAA